MTLTKEEIHQIQFELRNYSHDVPFCDGYQLATTKYLLQLKSERERAGKLMEALVAILKEPYGCRFCDSGKLRKPNNPAKDHDYDCGYLLAKTAINEYNNTRS